MSKTQLCKNEKHVQRTWEKYRTSTVKGLSSYLTLCCVYAKELSTSTPSILVALQLYVQICKELEDKELLQV